MLLASNECQIKSSRNSVLSVLVHFCTVLVTCISLAVDVVSYSKKNAPNTLSNDSVPIGGMDDLLLVYAML